MTDKRKQLLVAFCLPFIMCILLLLGNNVYPFGSSCILHVDMYHQYCPFFIEFWEKLRNGGSLLYSWNIGLGSDFVSLYAYYLASPLNWLIVLVPKGLVIEFMTLLIVLKISFSGMAFFYYLREHFSLHKEELFSAYAFSLAYAFCGFVSAYSWDIMWMDCIALAPLIILGLERMVKEGKPGLYYITLAISILANYYISMLICIFLVFYFIVLFFEQKNGKAKAFGRFTLYSLLAGGTGAILMLPEMKILSYSGSSGMNFPKTVEWYFSIVAELSRMCATAENYTGVDHWPNLYTGAFSILLFLLYIFNREISWKKKLPRVAMLAFFIVSFANNYLDFIWHGLHFPDSLPGRQSFLFSFVLLGVAYDALVHRRGIRIRYVIVSMVITAVVMVLSFSSVDPEITDPMSFVITGLFVGCYGVLIMLFKLHTISNKTLITNSIYILIVAELFLNMATTGFYTTSRTDYLAYTSDYEKLLDMAKEDSGEDSFYRVENTQRLTKNDGLKYDYKSATQFSSLMNINVSHFFQKLYMEGGKNYYCYNGATPITSAMLSVKYMIMNDPHAESDTLTLVGQSGKHFLYKNNYCLPLGYVIDEAAAESYEISTAKKIQGINNLGIFLGAGDDMLKTAAFRIEAELGKTTITFHENGHFYANYRSCSSDSLTFEFDNGSSWKYGKTTHSYLFDWGYHNAGEKVVVSNNKSEKLEFDVYKLNMNAVDETYNILAKQPMELEEYNDTYIKGRVDVKEPGRLVLSIANEDGWKLYVDGKQQEATSFGEAFISVYLEEGAHDIELRYMTPGLREGAILSGVCVAIFILSMLIRKKRLSNGKQIDNNSDSLL